jgi:hypothetical protein
MMSRRVLSPQKKHFFKITPEGQKGHFRALRRFYELEHQIIILPKGKLRFGRDWRQRA